MLDPPMCCYAQFCWHGCSRRARERRHLRLILVCPGRVVRSGYSQTGIKSRRAPSTPQFHFSSHLIFPSPLLQIRLWTMSFSCSSSITHLGGPENDHEADDATLHSSSNLPGSLAKFKPQPPPLSLRKMDWTDAT
ncbi:unnamed protein product [Mycena citricolor]|nr:unnamed protein product [Mycena citricolor]